VRSDDGNDGGLEPEIAVPDRTRLALLGGFSAVLVGNGVLFSGLIGRRTSIDPNAFKTADWLRAYADRRGLTYPENYVLSEWGRNRMYNYVVNGRSRSYAYARRHYENFLFTSDGVGWYDEFEGRVGFVVTREFETVGSAHDFHLYVRLQREFGSATDDAPGVGHFRAIYSSPDGEYKAFSLVPGATIVGSTEAERVATDVSIPNAEFEYVRSIERDENGRATVVVAHPGEYRVGDRRVTVTDRAVRTGDTVRLE
jgi:dolichyl-diphosphooligosaccharide--protein glycosyltransferase